MKDSLRALLAVTLRCAAALALLVLVCSLLALLMLSEMAGAESAAIGSSTLPILSSDGTQPAVAVFLNHEPLR